jgi:glycosyltransferase involved in cell wall biosynthesis
MGALHSPPVRESVSAAGVSVLITAGQYHPDHPAGANRLPYDEARFLAATGLEVWMLVQDVLCTGPEYELDGGLHVLRYQTLKLPVLDPRRIWAHRRAIAHTLSRHLPSVSAIHGHAPFSYSAACAFYPAAHKVFSVHSPVTMEMALNWAGKSWLNSTRRVVGLPLLKRLERECIDVSDAVSVDSEYTRSMLEKIHGQVATTRIKVIPGWVDLEPFRVVPSRATARGQLGWPEDVPVFFTLRRLVGRMGLEMLLRAVARLRNDGSNFCLMIGGDGPLRSLLEKTAAGLGLNGCAHFLGRVGDTTLPLMYSACDAFVLPTAALECFGLIAIEALAAGRPVLATPVGAIPEILLQVEPRWLALSAREDDFVSLLADFLSGNLPVHEPSELRELVEREYASERVIPQLVALLSADQNT